jgi:predicted kinase
VKLAPGSDAPTASPSSREADVVRIAERLAREHESARCDAETARHGAPEAVARRLRETVEGGVPAGVLDPARLAEVDEALRRFVEEHPERFLERVRRRRVRAVHGDRCLADASGGEAGAAAPDAGPACFADVCVEVAGVSLDLALAGRSDLAERLLAAYAEAASDYDLYRVVDFYERERARARALRHARRSARPGVSAAEAERAGAEARRHLLLALAAGRRPLLPPRVVATTGLVASGKSTVAAALAARMAAPRVVADRARRHLLEAPPAGDAGRSVAETAFAPRFDDAVYAELLAEADAVLASGRGAVLDACFPTRRSRAAARDLACRHEVPFLLVECRTDAAIRRRRLAARDRPDLPGEWLALHEAVAARFEPVSELDPAEHAIVDGARPLDEALALLEARLPLWPEPGTPP